MKQKDRAGEDSSGVDLRKERTGKMGITMGSLGKVDDLIKAIGEVENRDSIRAQPKEHSLLCGLGIVTLTLDKRRSQGNSSPKGL